MAESKHAGPPGTQRRGRGKNNEELIARLDARVETARKLRRDWKERYKVDKLAVAYLGTGDMAGLEAESTNRFWPTIKTILPALFFQNPGFHVRSSAKNAPSVTVEHASRVEGLLKSIADQEQMLKRSVKLALQQAFFSIGVLKSSYNPTEVPNPQAGEPVTLTDADGYPVINPQTGEPESAEDDEGNLQVEPKMIMNDEAYEWEWVNANNMLLPDAGPDPRKWSWIAEEITVPLQDAKDDSRFPKSLRNQLMANSSNNPDQLGYEATYSFDEDFSSAAGLEMAEITYIEHWDKRKQRHYITIDGQSFSKNSLLLDEPMPSGIENHPYALLLGFTPITDPKPSPWPLPHVFNWLHIQDEYNVRRTQMTNGANRTARKVLYDEGTFPDEDNAIRALESSRDMEAVKITSTDRPPVALQDPPLPQNIAQDVSFIVRDWLMITGQPGSRLADSRAGTATEAGFEIQSAEVRDVDMRADVADWLAVAGQKMFQLVRATLTLGRYIEMRGFNDQEFRTYIEQSFGQAVLQQIDSLPGLKESFAERFGKTRVQMVTRENIDFEATVTVVPGSFRPRTLESERAQALEFLALFAQAPQLGNSRELLRMIGGMFEFIDERLLDELHALTTKQVEINARQAGRLQGNENGQQAPPQQQQQQLPGGLSALLQGGGL